MSNSSMASLKVFFPLKRLRQCLTWTHFPECVELNGIYNHLHFSFSAILQCIPGSTVEEFFPPQKNNEEIVLEGIKWAVWVSTSTPKWKEAVDQSELRHWDTSPSSTCLWDRTETRKQNSDTITEWHKSNRAFSPETFLRSSFYYLRFYFIYLFLSRKHSTAWSVSLWRSLAWSLDTMQNIKRREIRFTYYWTFSLVKVDLSQLIHTAANHSCIYN